MSKVVPIDRDKTNAQSEWRIRDLKMQIAHNMALDAELSGNQHKVASTLLFVLIDGETGWCYQKDEQLAQIANVSLETLRRAIKSNSAFQRYFAVVPGTRKGRATEYQLTTQAMQEAARRRSGNLGLLERPNGENAISTGGSLPNERSPLVVKFATNAAKGGKSCPETEPEIPPIGGKNCLPTSEEKPMENPTCAPTGEKQGGEKHRQEKIETKKNEFMPDGEHRFSEFLEKYPRPGDRKKTALAYNALLSEGVEHVHLMTALKRYIEENQANIDGGKLHYLKHPDRWLTERYFDRYDGANDGGGDSDAILKQRAKAIRECRFWVQTYVSDASAREMITLGMVTEAECLAAGLHP